MTVVIHCFEICRLAIRRSTRGHCVLLSFCFPRAAKELGSSTSESAECVGSRRPLHFEQVLRMGCEHRDLFNAQRELLCPFYE